MGAAGRPEEAAQGGCVPQQQQQLRGGAVSSVPRHSEHKGGWHLGLLAPALLETVRKVKSLGSPKRSLGATSHSRKPTQTTGSGNRGLRGLCAAESYWDNYGGVEGGRKGCSPWK